MTVPAASTPALLDRTKTSVLRILARPHHKPPQRRYNAVIFKVDGIGDFVLATSAIRLLVAHYGVESCCLVVSKAVAGLARREFPGVACITLAVPSHGGPAHRILPRLLQDRHALSRIEADHLICLRHQRAYYHHLLLSWIRASRRYAVEVSQPKWMAQCNRLQFSCSLTDIVTPTPHDSAEPDRTVTCRELDHHRSLLDAVLPNPVSRQAIIPAFTYVHATHGTDLVVAPFAGHSIKDYPTALLVEVLREVLSETGIPIRVTGSPAQRPALESLRQELLPTPGSLITISCSENVGHYIKTVASARLVFTMDSATAHIATALDKPTVIILGGGHYGQFGPWQRSSHQIWLTHHMDCFQCSWHCTHSEPRCITSISATALRQAILRMLT
jgi:ADP-heptose:LPS heptosyltransferase